MLNAVMFSTSTCVHCKPVKALLDTQENLDVFYVVVDKQNNGPALAAEWEVQGVPTVLFIKNGELLARNVGAITQEQIDGIVKSLEVAKELETDGYKVDSPEV